MVIVSVSYASADMLFVVQPECDCKKWIGKGKSEEQQAHDPEGEHDEYFPEYHEGAPHIVLADAGNHSPEP